VTTGETAPALRRRRTGTSVTPRHSPRRGRHPPHANTRFPLHTTYLRVGVGVGASHWLPLNTARAAVGLGGRLVLRDNWICKEAIHRRRISTPIAQGLTVMFHLPEKLEEEGVQLVPLGRGLLRQPLLLQLRTVGGGPLLAIRLLVTMHPVLTVSPFIPVWSLITMHIIVAMHPVLTVRSVR